MKPLLVSALCAAACLCLLEKPAPAGNGYITACKNQKKIDKFQREAEARLNRFWHDYYDSLGRYYGNLSRIDWLTYYKNHGQQIYPTYPCGNSCQPTLFAPVFVNPMVQYAMPGNPPSGPDYCADYPH